MPRPYDDGVLGTSAWPLVGRASLVESVADLVVRGRGVALIGEPGVGRSRVGHAVLDRLAADGWTGAAFEAGPAAAAVPFLPFASLLQAESQETLERVVNAAAALVARGEHVVALVDDVHALDDVSLGFVSHLLSATDVRLVLTFRSGEESTRLLRAWGDALPPLELPPLDRPAVEELVYTALGPAEPSAVRWIWDTVAGNPLFLRELLADAVERGALVEVAGRWTLGTGARPPGRRLHDVVIDRFGTLWDAERDAVELLAIAGPLGLRLFEKLATPEVVQELEHRGLIAADRSGRRVNVRLSHRIHGEVIREQLGPSTIDFHRRRLLEAMSTIGERRVADRVRAALWRVELGDTGDPGSLVATAEELFKLIDGSVARPSTARGDGVSSGAELLRQAVQLGRAALDAGGGLPAAVVLISALSRLGRHREAHAVRASLDELVADEADRVLVAKLLAEIDGLVLGDPAAACARLGELESLVTSPDLVRSLRATLTTSLLAIGQPKRALDLAEQILADPDATVAEQVRCAIAAAAGLGYAGRTSAALEQLEHAAHLAAATDAGRSIGAVVPRIVALANAGRFDELDQLLTFCRTLSEQHGYDDGVALFAGGLANASLLRGMPRTALRWTDVASQHVGDRDPMGLQRIVHATRAHAHALLGDVRAASAAVAELDALDPTGGFALEDVRARAWVHVASGRRAAAIGMLLADAEACAERGHVAGALGHLHDVGRLGSADVAHPQMTELAAGTDSELISMQVRHVTALAGEDTDELELAARGFADLGAHLAAAEAFAQAAAIHRRAGRQARSSAAAARSRELLGACEGATTPALAGAEPLVALTRREREIVQLAADGLSDRDIAERLVVSVRTVESHLHNAYAKLGVQRRDALSAAIAPY